MTIVTHLAVGVQNLVARNTSPHVDGDMMMSSLSGDKMPTVFLAACCTGPKWQKITHYGIWAAEPSR